MQEKRFGIYFKLPLLFIILVVCVSVGSVTIPFFTTVKIIGSALFKYDITDIPSHMVSIILSVRLPRVIAAWIIGAALSVSGVSMQGLLKNPLADGTTLGVASGASLGAVIAIVFSQQIPFLGGSGILVMSIVFTFLSMIFILLVSKKIDYTLSTNTIILVGVIFSMFSGSLTSLFVTFAGNKLRSIMFWTMGSLSGIQYSDVVLVLFATLISGSLLYLKSEELNAFAIGEDNARGVGVDVRLAKLQIMALVSVLIGVSVAISGVIGFVGLIVPHITRFIVGANHKRLIPNSMLFGGCFLMLADLISRTLLKPIELPIGVVTSFIGSVVFIYIFYAAFHSGGKK